MISDESLKDLTVICALAGCAEHETRAVLLQATGHTQEQIAALYERRQTWAHRTLRSAHRKIRDWQASAEREDRHWCEEVWHLVQQEVEETPGRWRPAAIAKTEAPERPTDRDGNPVLPPVKAFAPEDLAAEHTQQVVGVLTQTGEGVYNLG
jgi:hypothetical protein